MISIKGGVEVGVIYSDELFGKFANDINEETYLQIILKGHLYIENRLIELIKVKLVNPHAINLNDLNFPTKINLARALGLLDNKKSKLLRNLNRIRNNLAHDLNFELSDGEIKKQIKYFDKYYSNSFQKTIEENAGDLKQLLRNIYVLTYLELDLKIPLK